MRKQIAVVIIISLFAGCKSEMSSVNDEDIRISIVPHVRHACEISRHPYASMTNNSNLSRNHDSPLMYVDFFIAFENRSLRPFYIPDEEFSIGHSSLVLDIRTLDGISITLEKKPGTWTRNFPAFYTLQPGEVVVYPVSLDLRVWEGMPLLFLEKGGKYSVRARFKGGLVLLEDKADVRPMEILTRGVPIDELVSSWKNLDFRK